MPSEIPSRSPGQAPLHFPRTDAFLPGAMTRGVFWSGATQVVTQSVSFAVGIVVARLLAPQDFGILGMVAIFIELVTILGDLGLNSAIVQRKDVSNCQLTACFWVSVITSILLLGVTALCAPLVAGFFRREEVATVAVVSFAGCVLRSFGSVHRAILTRGMSFRRLAIPEVVSIVVFGATVIPMAVRGLGFWSVVLSNLAAAAAATITLWAICPWRPGLRLSWRPAGDLFVFGSRVLGEQLLGFINLNIDYVIIGRALGAWSLGVYTLAFNLMTYPLRKIAQMITRVAFPAFSRIQGDDALLQEGYLRTVRCISLVTFPILSTLAVMAPSFIRVVYGSKWMAAVFPLQLMCIDGLVRTISTTTGSIQLAKGRADIALKWKVFTVVVVPPSILLGARWGVAGVAAAVAATEVLLAPIIQVVTNRLIGLGWRKFVDELMPAAVGSVVLVVWLLVLTRTGAAWLVDEEAVFLTLAVITGVGAYILSLRVLFGETYRDVVGLASRIRDTSIPCGARSGGE